MNSDDADFEKTQFNTPRSFEEIAAMCDNERSSNKRVTFQRTKTNNQIEFMDEFREDLMTSLRALKNHADKIEKGNPMQRLKTQDEMHQIKRFIAAYYKPILTPLELESLTMGGPRIES